MVVPPSGSAFLSGLFGHAPSIGGRGLVPKNSRGICAFRYRSEYGVVRRPTRFLRLRHRSVKPALRARSSSAAMASCCVRPSLPTARFKLRNFTPTVFDAVASSPLPEYDLSGAAFSFAAWRRAPGGPLLVGTSRTKPLPDQFDRCSPSRIEVFGLAQGMATSPRSAVPR